MLLVHDIWIFFFLFGGHFATFIFSVYFFMDFLSFFFFFFFFLSRILPFNSAMNDESSICQDARHD